MTTFSRAAVAGGLLHGVEQLGNRHGGRPTRVRPLVIARVGDHERLGGRHERIEQQLAVLAARVALADAGIAQKQVVAVAGRHARERAVVQAEQADDAVRHRPHRQQRADGQRARAEVRARRSPGEPVGEQLPHLGRRDIDRRGAGLADEVVQDAVQLCALPDIARGDVRDRVGRFGDRGRPRAHRLSGAQARAGVVEPVQQLGEPPGEVDGARVDVVQRQRLAPQAPAILGDGSAEQHPVQPGAPGTLGHDVEPEPIAVPRLQAPADARGGDPALEAAEVVVVQAEATADGLAVREIQDRRGGHAAGDEVQQRGDRAEDGIGLPDGAVSQADAQPGRAVAVVVLVAGVGLDAPGAERRRNERARSPRCQGT